jgi:1,2-diacylglycerol 3-alpha-glucosyltransferase
MKIVYASDAYYPRRHGVAVCIDSSIRYLAEQGHEIHVIAPHYPAGDTREYPKGITVHRFDSYNLWFTSNKEERFVYKREFSRMRALLDELKPDLIHIHLEFTIGFVVRNWALRNNVPLAMTIHTYYPPYFKIYVPAVPLVFWRWFIKFMSRRFYSVFDLLLTPSDEMRKVLQNQYRLNKEVEVVPIGIDINNFTGVDRRYEYENSEIFQKFPRIKNRRRLLFVGRIGSEKNIEFLFSMMQKLIKKRTDVELVMVGTGSYMARYQNIIRLMKIDGYVSFVGTFPNNYMKHVYAIGDVFTFASITETQGVVTTEALVNGLPVVAVAALGSIDTLAGEKGGFLVKEDINVFIEKVELLLDNPAIYARKKAEAEARAKELSFNVTTGPLLLKHYNNLLEKKSTESKEQSLASADTQTALAYNGVHEEN